MLNTEADYCAGFLKPLHWYQWRLIMSEIFLRVMLNNAQSITILFSVKYWLHAMTKILPEIVGRTLKLKPEAKNYRLTLRWGGGM